MRRVAITGLGAVTPVGNDLRSTWDALVAGQSGVDVIRSFDATDFPVNIAAEVKDFDPSKAMPAKEVRRTLERRPLRRLRGARGGRRRRARHRQALAHRRRHRERDGRPALHAPAAADPRGARLGPRVAALAPEHARRHVHQPRRDAARRPRHQLLDRVRLRHRHPRDRRGDRGDRPRPGRRRAGRRDRVVDGADHPRGLLRDARARRRPRRPGAGLAAVRRRPAPAS